MGGLGRSQDGLGEDVVVGSLLLGGRRGTLARRRLMIVSRASHDNRTLVSFMARLTAVLSSGPH